ncbi:hypothetical protein ABIE44_001382 [Marmoricola sp. OAE513]|uniref:DUF6270 domain-containing protein n=1 Tax=Marmoricola sp. OAE513 TaxID=2817894 RepID=UPI001AE74D6F
MSRRTVAVCGSCATRDPFSTKFNPDYKRWYDTPIANFQNSFLALMSPPIEPEIGPDDTLDEYEERTLRADMTRSFLTDLIEVKPDYLIIDFSGDVWFGTLRLPDGRYLTDTEWKLRKTQQYQRLVEAGGLTTLGWRVDADAYFEIWTESMARFAAHLAEHCPDTHVIVHRIRSVDEVTLGATDRPRNLHRWARLKPVDVPTINRFRARLDDHVISTYGWDSIDLRSERYTSHSAHPWGAFWVHYTFDYHRRFLAEVHRRDLVARLDDRAADRIRVIAEAGSEHLVQQARLIRRADKAQRSLRRRLERRGVLATGRAVLGRQLRTRKVAAR